MRSLGAVLQKAARVIVVLSLILGFEVVFPNGNGDLQKANAATVGSGICTQTVGSSANVVVSQSGNTCTVRFNASNTWTAPTGISALQVLVVGGGGGGAGGSQASGDGARGGGGGGAGGAINFKTAAAFTAGGSFTVTVGAGGAGGAANNTNGGFGAAGTAGGSSSLAGTGLTTLTAAGGGGGTGQTGGTGTDAGGDGGSTSATINGTVTNYSGGANNWEGAGGGAGAGAAGVNGTDIGGRGGNGGNGGAGNSQTVGELTANWGAGGGGGGTAGDSLNGTAGTGGSGGGGNGGIYSTAPTAGTANVGGGGGGGGGYRDATYPATNGASGGSGTVIIAYTESAPTLSSGAVNAAGTQLTLTFSEPMSASTPAASTFAVKNANIPNPVTSVTASGSTLVLALQEPVYSGQAVTVAYTDPTAGDDTNAAQDNAGFDAASFAAGSITVSNGATSSIPKAARLIGLGTQTLVNLNDGVGGNIRGITSDGTKVYMWRSTDSTKMWEVPLSSITANPGGSTTVTPTSWTITSPPTMNGRAQLVYSSGCLFVIDTSGTLKCIDVTTRAASTVTVPAGNPLPVGRIWMTGNLIGFPDGRIGKVGEPAAGGYGSTTLLRIYKVTGTGSSATLSWDSDLTLDDTSATWPGDDHGSTTDGTYLYRLNYATPGGYKVWRLRTDANSAVAFDAFGSGACGASAGTSGTLCAADLGIVTNPTFIGRDHLGGRLFVGDFDGSRFYMTESANAAVTVSYDTQGGSAIASGSTPLNGAITSTPGTPTKAGYAFTGWFTAASGGSAITFPYVHGQSSNFTLYAQWTPGTYAVSFDAQGGNAVASSSWTYGTSLTLPTPTRSGYSFAGWSTTAQGSTLVYQTTTPTRSGNAIVYSSGYGKGGSDVAATLTNNGTTFNRVRYRMEANYSGTLRYADVSFDKWSGATIADLAVPDLSDTRVIKQNVSNLSVDSNWPGFAGVAGAVTTGSGKQGRVELWPYNYSQATTGISPAGSGSVYDYDDTSAGASSYGSFQVHNLTDLQTVLAWNNHSVANPDIGMGNNVQTCNGMVNPDWTFCANGNFNLATWKLQIFIGDLLAGGSSYSPPNTSGFTLYAQWTPNPLTVTYDSQGGSAVSNGSTVTAGSIAASPGTPTRAGYSFAGWFAAASGGSAITFPYTHGRTADFTLYAQWTGNTNTVTYDSQGGSAASSSSWVTGTTLTLPAAPTRSGFVFSGWYSAASGGSRVGGGGDSYTPANTSGFTLYAQWSGNQYVYDANTGSGSTASQTYAGSVLSARSNGFTPPTGYSFAGWCTTQPAVGSACGGTPYAAAANLPTPASATVTLYAAWSINPYTVTYDGNGSTGGSVPTAQIQNYGSTVNVKGNTGSLVRSGYTFTGWNTAADGSGTGYTTMASGLDYSTYACGSGASPARPCNASVLTTGTVTSIWNNWGSGAVLNSGRADWVMVKYEGFLMSPTSVTATFRVDGDDGQYLTFNGSNIISTCWYDKGSGSCDSGSVSLAAGVYYPFTFWFYENGGGATAYFSWNTGAGFVQVPNANLYRTAQTGSFTLTGDTTLYAQWAGNSNTVTYNAQGGSSVASATWVTGTALTLPTAPTRAGYTLAGWFTASSGGSKVGNAAATYSPANTTDFTLYAQWTANTLAITYDVQGGSAVAAGSTVTGSSIVSSPGIPTRDGYTFKGWFVASSGGSVLTFPYAHGRTADFTLYAQWWINQAGFTVTGAPASLSYGGSATLGTAGGNGGGAVVFATTSPGVCSVNASSGVVDMLVGTGTCSIAVTKASDATYAATSATADITASKATQSALTVSGPAAGSYGATVALSTSGGSTAGTVTWTEGTSTACTVNSSGSVSITAGAGTCVVTATMAGSGNYLPGESAPFTIAVSRATQSALTVTSTSVTYGQTLSLTTSGGSGTGVVTWEITLGTCTIDGSTLTPGDAGSACQVRATKAQDTNWLAAQTAGTTVNIGRATQSTLTVTSTSVTYGQTLSLTTSGGSGTGVVTWVKVSGTCTIDGSTLTPGDAGSACQVRATKAQDTNWLVKQSSNTTVTVDRAAQSGFTISSEPSFTIGSSHTLTTTGGQSSGSVTWTLQSGSCTLSGSTLTATRGGITCSVQATKVGDTNWLASSDTRTVTVDKIPQTITFRSAAPSPATVGGTYTVTVDSTAFLAPTLAIANQSQSVCSVVAGVVTFNTVGSCVISASQAGNDVYTPAAVSQSVTVTAVAAAAPTATVPAPVVSAPVAPETTASPASTSPAVVTTTTTTVPAPKGNVAATTTTTSTTTTTVPADPSSPQAGANGLPPDLAAGETTALVRGQSVRVKVEKLDEAVVLTLPNNVKITIGRTAPGGDSVSVAADGVLRMYRDDTVDVAVAGLVPGTTYTVFMFSAPIELGRGETNADGSVKTSVRVPKDAPHGGHTIQVNGVGPGGEMVSTSMGFEVLERRSNTGMVIFALGLGVLLAMLGGRPIFAGRRRRPRKA